LRASHRGEWSGHTGQVIEDNLDLEGALVTVTGEQLLQPGTQLHKRVREVVRSD
jgi:hypothetical protein